MSPSEELAFRKRPADEDEDELRKEQGIEVLGEAVRANVERTALLAACKQSLSWFDEVYPADIFTGESGDAGAIRIRNMREACRAAIQIAEER